VTGNRTILRIVFLTVFIDLLGFGIVIPLLPLYAEKYHPSPLAFGLLMSSYSAMQFVFGPLLGRLSDRYGRRPVIIFSLLGTVIGYLLFAFARSLPMLFVARLLPGATGGNIGTAQAVIADSTTPAERSRGMAMVGIAFGLGFIFGPAIGGFSVHLGESAPGLFAAALSAIACLWAFFRLPETRPGGRATPNAPLFATGSLLRAFRRPEIGALMLLSFVTTTAFANFESTFAQFLSLRLGTGPSTVAWFFVFVGVCSVVVQGGLVRRLVPRFGEARLVMAGCVLLIAGFLLLRLGTTVPRLLAAIAVIALGIGVTTPTLSSLVSRRTAATEQGEVLGAYQSMASLGRVFGPFAGENLYLRVGPDAPHWAAAVLQGGALVLSAAGLLKHNGDAPTRAEELPP
jgi:DHA1 family tetracycline resistance protein-like MFS transporter